MHYQTTRRLHDHLTRETHTFTGQTEITPEKFTETGILKTPHSTHQATRTYHIKRAGDTTHLTHPNGDPFLTLTPTQTTYTHHCDQDTYTITLKVNKNKTKLLETWHVQGPKKNYTSRTLHKRLT